MSIVGRRPHNKSEGEAQNAYENAEKGVSIFLALLPTATLFDHQNDAQCRSTVNKMNCPALAELN
jgi:hypothetical protein